MRVLVTDGDSRAALAVTRSLGRLGHHVVVGERRSPSLAQSSRFCVERMVYPDPAGGSDAFVEHLRTFVMEQRIDVVVPVADVTTLLLTNHRDRFEPCCAVPFGQGSVVARAADKVDVYETAARIGVPVPRSVVVSPLGPVPETDFGFPVVVKPRRSRVRTEAGWVSSAVSYAADRRALLRDLAGRPRHDFPLLVQERIEGPGLGVFACYQNGRPVALFGHRRLRERPPWGGVSTLSESTLLDDVARDGAVRLLDEIGWSGVAMVEFKRDLRDGLPKLMEINGRFWGSLQLAVDAGVDFPALLLRSLQPEAMGSPAPYKIGVRSRWLWGDLDSLLLVLVGKARAMGAPISRWRALADFAWCRGDELHYENPRWNDLGPWWHETRERFALAMPVRALQAVPAPARVHADRIEMRRRPPVPCTARVASSLADTGLEESRWNTLVDASETQTIFQTHQWVRACHDAFGDRQEPLYIVVSRGGQPVGVAPLVLDRRTRGRHVIRFLGDARSDYCDVIAGDLKEQVVEALVDTLARDHRWDVLEFNRIPSTSRTADLLEKVCARTRFRTMVVREAICPTLVIHGHEAEARSIRDRASLRRRINYFRRSGALTYRDFHTREEIEPYLDRFFQQHIARWALAGTPSLFLNPKNVEFYRALTGHLSETGWLLFSAVELDGNPIACHYGFDFKGTLMWYKPAFDVRHARHSPGMVMVAHLLDYAIENNRRELDFTVGDEPFKKRFTNRERHTERVLVFREGFDYAIERSRQTLLRGVRRLARP